MSHCYEHVVLTTAPRSWRAVIAAMPAVVDHIGDTGGEFYGLWISQIGLPMNEGVVMARWPDARKAGDASALLLAATSDIQSATSTLMDSTVRPLLPAPPTENGVYMHRWFETRDKDFDEFLALSADAWPDYEASFGARIVGFWRCRDAPHGIARALLVTRYPDMTAWEQSRAHNASTEKGSAVWDSLLRRHELTNAMVGATMQLMPIGQQGAQTPGREMHS